MDKTARNKERRTFLLTAVVCVVFFLCSALLIFALQQQYKRENIDYVSGNTAREQTAITQHVEGNFQTLKGIAVSLAPLELTDEEMIAHLATINSENSFTRMGYVPATGVTDLVSVDGRVNRGFDFSKYGFFKQAIRGESALSKTMTAAITHEDVNYYGVPIKKDNEIVGVLIGVNEASEICARLSVSVFHEKGFYTILDETGTITVPTADITPEDPTTNEGLEAGAHFEKIAHFTADNRETFYNAVRSGESCHTQATIGSQSYELVTLPLGINDWSLVGSIPTSAIDSYFNTTAIGASAIVIVACAIFVILMWRQRRSMMRNRSYLENLAYTDQLTGLNNYEKFKIDAQQTLDKNPGIKYSLWSLDVKHFKNFNDIFGFAEGDELLKKIAKILSEVSSDDTIFCRESSDNFACLRPYRTSDELVTLFEEVVKRMDTAQLAPANEMNINLAAGIYCPSDFDEELSVSDMVNRAVLAKKKAKGSGGNSLEFFTVEMSDIARWESEIAAAGKIALESGGIIVYLQPKVGIQEGAHIVGVEALARWPHIEHGWISPADFVPVFEKEGMVTQLDRCMFEETCRWYRTYLDAGFPPINVAINVSLLNVFKDDFVHYYVSTRAKYGLENSKIELELTESVIAEDYDLLIKITERLHAEGFICSVDDFGSGYSSLNVLKTLPADVLKLDTMFFHGAADVAREKTVVEGLITMVKELDMITVAEGVEEQEQVAFLREVGCDIVQGYVFSKPISPDAFENLMRRTNGNLENE